MEKLLKNAVILFQILFYCASALAVIAFVFWFFTELKFRTVGYLILSGIIFLLIYFLLFRLYDGIYKTEDYKTLPELLDDLEDTDHS